jgi:hypothetical protein
MVCLWQFEKSQLNGGSMDSAPSSVHTAADVKKVLLPMGVSIHTSADGRVSLLLRGHKVCAEITAPMFGCREREIRLDKCRLTLLYRKDGQVECLVADLLAFWINEEQERTIRQIAG